MKINTALVLCAGYGKRLNPLTLKKPKPLLNLNDETLLENTINIIKNLGINKIKINTFYLKQQIRDYIRKNNFEINIDIIDDGEKILNTGGGIYNMICSSKEENFLVFNPDTIWNTGYLECIQEMKNFYLSKNIESILLVVNKNLSFDQSLQGDFNLSKNKLKKNQINEFIFTGCQIISKKLFRTIKNKSFSILELWNFLINNQKLFGYESKNKFYHVTNLEIYQRLLENK